MLCTIVPWADAIYIFERTGKVKLIGIADHGADGADGKAAFSQQLCRPCHAVVQQEPLWAFAHGISEHLAEIAAVLSADACKVQGFVGTQTVKLDPCVFPRLLLIGTVGGDLTGSDQKTMPAFSYYIPKCVMTST